MGISNSLIKWVFSLGQKKNRAKEHCFVVEGTKCVLDTCSRFTVRYLFATEEWADVHGRKVGVRPMIATASQLERMSMLKTPAEVIAVYEIPEENEPFVAGHLVLALDGIQDPGNLGTIIRIADWFGIRTVVCSENTVDAYNPKVVQATMGAISRVNVHYCRLEELFRQHPDMPVFGTFLDGRNIYRETLSDSGFIVLGNEGNGISSALEPYMTKRLLIPSWQSGVETSESLNVGMAAAVVVSEFRRRMM